MNTHAILAKLHGLLQLYSRDEFTAAAHYPAVTPSVRSALLALAEECTTKPAPPPDEKQLRLPTDKPQ